MGTSIALSTTMSDQDRNIRATIAREGARLRGFIRRRVADPGEAEDILQDVFAELVEAARLVQPIEQAGAWLLRVARNRIIDAFRRRKAAPVAYAEATPAQDDEDALESFLPAEEDGPEARYARRVLIEEIDAALDELPPEQRDVFVAHEIEGRSFRDIAAQTGVSISTLLSRKRYAVLHLRARLRALHDEMNIDNRG
jgi:RNA polymerase sigma factor (sigma-70 family)